MKPAKSYLNENEAAESLGVSAGQLRSLIRSHVTTEESDMSKVGITQFQPADLLLLRFLIGQSRGEAVSVQTPLDDAVSVEAARTAEPVSSGESESSSILDGVDAVPAASTVA